MAKGVKIALEIDILDNLNAYPLEDFICSGRLYKKLIKTGCIDEYDKVTREYLKRILDLLKTA